MYEISKAFHEQYILKTIDESDGMKKYAALW